MTTSSINHRRAAPYAAAIGLVGILLSTAPASAHAMPARDDGRTGTGHYIGHACFITPSTWNEALDGPLPRCYTYVP
jgi:hypothetical protein